MTGTIKTLLRDRKCGFIRVKGRPDIFFHQSGLKDCAYEDLKEGDAVTFIEEDSPKGPRAEEVQLD